MTDPTPPRPAHSQSAALETATLDRGTNPARSALHALPQTPQRASLTAACRCGTRWSGERAAHCAAAGCHQTFTTVGNFDRHRRGGTCHDPATIGLTERTRSGYTLWSQPNTHWQHTR